MRMRVALFLYRQSCGSPEIFGTLILPSYAASSGQWLALVRHILGERRQKEVVLIESQPLSNH